MTYRALLRCWWRGGPWTHHFLRGKKEKLLFFWDLTAPQLEKNHGPPISKCWQGPWWLTIKKWKQLHHGKLCILSLLEKRGAKNYVTTTNLGNSYFVKNSDSYYDRISLLIERKSSQVSSWYIVKNRTYLWTNITS